jgi:hypothetical protein
MIEDTTVGSNSTQLPHNIRNYVMQRVSERREHRQEQHEQQKDVVWLDREGVYFNLSLDQSESGVKELEREEEEKGEEEEREYTEGSLQVCHHHPSV